jgi:glycosyltransferase involved in cell wall biosynthesis
MRVTLISLHFSEYAARLALALAERHTVQLHLSQPNAEKELEAGLLEMLRTKIELHLHPHPARKHAPWHGLSIAKAIRRFRPDVVHGQEAADWTMWFIRKLLGAKPFAYTVHDPLPHSGDDKASAARVAWPRTRLRRTASAILVHGKAIVPTMKRAEPALQGQVHVVMHGLLGDDGKHNAPREADLLLFFGRIEAYKGLDVLLATLEILQQRSVPCRLLIAGRGPDLARHAEAIARLPHVEVRDGFIPAQEVGPMLARAACVVLPYHDATQSGVAAHAFGAGTPVIASQVGALPDVVSHGHNGLLVPPGDAAALADSIATFLGDPALATTLAAGARETAATLLSWPAISTQTEAIYASLTGDTH